MKLGEVASLGAIVGVIATGVVWYHEKDNEPLVANVAVVASMAKQLNEIQKNQEQQGEDLKELATESVVDRLASIYEIKCRPETTIKPSLQIKLNALLAKYYGFMGIEYDEPC